MDTRQPRAVPADRAKGLDLDRCRGTWHYDRRGRVILVYHPLTPEAEFRWIIKCAARMAAVKVMLRITARRRRRSPTLL